MTIEEFKSDENIGLLWEIIVDVNDKPKNVDNLKLDFLFKVGKFIEIILIQKNEKMDCLNLNKIFITNYVGSLESQNVKTNTGSTTIVPIKQQSDPEPELITFEEIQNNKRTTFEKELKLKQRDFENSMANNVPEIPNFKVGDLDKPISEMDDLIARTLAQRNYEIDQIHNQHMNPQEAEKWLHPQETSVKAEKLPIRAAPSTSKQVNAIEENKSIDRHVSWGENLTFDIQEIKGQEPIKALNQVPNIFSKLKMKPNPQSSEEQNNQHNQVLQENNSIKIKKLQDDVLNINQKIDNMMTILEKFSEKVIKKID
jgi:hypothetical protein